MVRSPATLPPPSRSWRRRYTAGQCAILLILGVLFVVGAYPFFYVLSLAVMPYSQYVRQAIHAWPSGFSLTYFQEILSDPRLATAFRISVLKTVVGATLNVVATTMAAYALSRPRLKFRRFLTFIFLVPLFVGGGLIPYFLVIRTLGLLNTFWALILPGLVGSFYLFMARATLINYPQEVIEAAHVDGAGHFSIFWRIVWPTSIPLISTLALLYGIGHWNEYFWSSFLVQPDLYPAPVVLYNLITSQSMLATVGVGQQMAPQSYLAAMAAIMIIPVLVIYPFLQRYLVQGLMIGSLKG